MAEVLRHWLAGDDYEHGGNGFMGKSWDSFVPGPSVWREAFRVLKPGGHLVAFFGTRTYDLGVLALRLAGFEIRDQLAWVFGSGFPKSHDVSKGIDKLDAADVRRDRALRFTAWIRSQGISSSQIDAVTGTNMGGHYTTAASQPAIATREHFERIRHMFREVPPAWLELMIDERTVESENYAKRAITQEGLRSAIAGETISFDQRSSTDRERRDVAHSPEAAQWQGWGTAIKPAYEPVVLCRKPLSERTVAANVLRWGTGALNIDGCRVGTTDNLNGGAYSNGSKDAADATSYVTGVNAGDFVQPPGRWPANIAHDGSPEVLAGFPTSSVTGKRSDASKNVKVEGTAMFLDNHKSTEYTDSGSAARFFKTCELGDEDWLVQNLPHAIASIADNLLSLRNLFDAFALGLAANSVRLGEMRSNECPALSTRVTLSESKSVCEMLMQAIRFSESAFSQESPPTKLSLSLSLAQFVADLTPTGITLTMTDLWISSGFVAPITFNFMPTNSGLGVKGFGQSTARFNYCAKASKSDRNEGLDDLPEQPSAASEFRPNHTEGAANGEDGNPYGRWTPTRNNHPTVKPTALMQWLVRMVTPPGGLVLDPFTGSGSTGKAAMLEGFSFVGCEMDPEYAKIARLRIDHAVNSR